MYRIITPPDIQRGLALFPPALKRRIRSALDGLADDPFQGKALKEELTGLHSFRVLRYRIVYAIRPATKEVRIFGIGHRRNIYQAVRLG